MQTRRFLPTIILIGVAAGAAAFGYTQWQKSNGNTVYRSNGRLEARQSHIASRLPGTVARLSVQEGDHVQQGQLLAELDSRPLQAEIVRADAAIQQARDQSTLARAQLAQHESECDYARNQLGRIQSLSRKQYVSLEQLDNTHMRAESCDAVINASKAQIAAAESALKVAEAGSARLHVDLDDMKINAPFSGYILYRLVEAGEIIPPGGRLFTLVSDTDIYLTVFLPAEVSGKLALGDAVALKIDAKPEVSVPAIVSLLAPEAQFTPKTVETSSERSKLMFRTRLNVDPAFLQQNTWLKSGMPGEVVLQLGASRKSDSAAAN
ncbi:MAG TPA: HlyD family efflux transporter periplasmic adaptor subunit [Pseudomonadales bacterium]|nr:HlyD family efflux transporter periplasmic adaptor subunit [Pseudomonadales bacterium]